MQIENGSPTVDMEQQRSEVLTQLIWVMCNTADVFVLAVETFVLFLLNI